ncbi:hypothetical protein TGAMA5MH_10713 [Trichoderma gamsii]|uniref:Uncharacterized protein n=1 Tax=Trichoderma gamsii TaxID=398673 RepID=A0A2K0SVY5_9HYPO|nr:hypothetical protein TGAMA5MH_10713 [Trichoderma gamsii]
MFPAGINQSIRRSVTLQADSDRATTQPSSLPTIQPSVEGSVSPTFCDDELLRSVLRAPSPSNQYPLSRQVQNLERREREAQRKCNSLEEKCRELSLALEHMTKERDEDKTNLEQRCGLAEAKLISVEAELKKQYDMCVAKYEASEAEQKLAIRNLNNHLKKERQKTEQLCERNLALHDENANLTTELAAMSDKYASSEIMLKEKTLESRLYRCAYSTVFKYSISIKEKCTVRDVLVRVIGCMRDERRRERESQAIQGQDDEQEAQPEHSTLESSLFVSSSSVEAAAKIDDSSLGLSSPSSRRKRVMANQDGDQGSSEVSDDDMPLIDLRRKRAKKFEDDIKVL